MLKKHGWIAALFVAVAMVFMACPPPDNGGGGEFDRTDEFYWLLTEAMTDAEIEAGAFADSAAAKAALNPIGIDLAGSPPVTALAGGGLEVTANASWGAGIDLMNDFFMFQEGDTITVTGKVLEGAGAAIVASDAPFVTTQAGSDDKVPSTLDGINFTKTLTLTAAQVAQIRTMTDTQPRAIRIGAPNGVKFEVTEIEFIAIGYVPEGFQEVEEISGVPTEGFVGIAIDLNEEASILPHLAAVNKTIVWSKKTGDEGTATYTLVDGVIEASTAGTANIVATVVGGLENGDFSDNFTITFTASAATVAITVGGATQQITPVAVGTVTDLEILPDGSGYSYSIGSSEYQGSWVKFNLNLGSRQLKEFASVTLKVKQTNPQVPNTYQGYKNVALLAAATLPATLEQDQHTKTPAVTNAPQTGGSNTAQETTSNMTLVIDFDKASALTASALEVSLFINAETGWAYEVYDIVFVLAETDVVCSTYPCICVFPAKGIEETGLSITSGENPGISDAFYDAILQARIDGKGHGFVMLRTLASQSIGAGNGNGNFGQAAASNIVTTKALSSGDTDDIKIPLSAITGKGINIWGGLAITAYELWLPEAP